MVQYTVAKNIAYITLNRPEKHNALNTFLIQKISNTLKKAQKDYLVKIVIVKATGKTFCAGIDLEEVKHLQYNSSAENNVHAQTFADLLYQIYTFPKIVIGAIQGPAIGGGGGLIATFDFSFCTKNVSIQFPEIQFGFVPALVLPFLIQKIGIKNAKKIIYTGKKIDTSQAQNIGLITHCISQHLTLMDSIHCFVETKKKQFHALSQTKYLFLHFQDQNLFKNKLDTAVAIQVQARKNIMFDKVLT